MYANPDQSDRLVRRAAARPGNPRHRNPDVGTHSFPNSGRHLECHLLADGSFAITVPANGLLNGMVVASGAHGVQAEDIEMEETDVAPEAPSQRR